MVKQYKPKNNKADNSCIMANQWVLQIDKHKNCLFLFYSDMYLLNHFFLKHSEEGGLLRKQLMNYVAHHLETCWEPKLEGKDGNREGVESKNQWEDAE